MYYFRVLNYQLGCSSFGKTNFSTLICMYLSVVLCLDMRLHEIFPFHISIYFSVLVHFLPRQPCCLGLKGIDSMIFLDYVILWQTFWSFFCFWWNFCWLFLRSLESGVVLNMYQLALSSIHHSFSPFSLVVNPYNVKWTACVSKKHFFDKVWKPHLSEGMRTNI